jgi:N-acetylglutamate synthase-like GNAT family acetyltransferase
MPAIRKLIRETHINPLDLNWQRFIVAVNGDPLLIGTGQIKAHRDGSRELASIAVRSGYRRQGIARAIIELLLDEYPGNLYLTCREHLGKFYARFGFQVVESPEMPPYFRQAFRFVNLFKRIGIMKEGLLVMRRPEVNTPAMIEGVEKFPHLPQQR